MSKQKAKSLSADLMTVNDGEPVAAGKAAVRVQTIRISSELLKAIKIACAQRDISQQDLVVLAIRKELGLPV